MFETTTPEAPPAARPDEGSPPREGAPLPGEGAPLPADPDGLLDLIEDCERRVALLHATQLRAMAALEEARRGTPLADFAADEVSIVLRMGPHAARDRLWVARELTTRLPATLAALATGDIDLYKARCVVEATTRLDDDAQVAAVEARVLPDAVEQSATQLRAALRKAVLAADPEGGERRHRAAREERRVERSPEEDGMAALWVYGPADGVSALYTALDGAARTLRRQPGEQRTLDQLRVDTLLGVGRAICDAGGLAGVRLAGRRGARPHLHVTVGADTLLGVSDEPGWLAGYGPIPASMARDIAGDATWRRLLTDPVTGSLLDYSADTHDPGVVLAGHVLTRDQTCRFPTCNVTAEYCDIDHTIAYPKGPTVGDNLGSPCRRHHRAKQAGFALRQPTPGVFEWTTPAGRRCQVLPPSLAPPRPDHQQRQHPPPGGSDEATGFAWRLSRLQLPTTGNGGGVAAPPKGATSLLAWSSLPT